MPRHAKALVDLAGWVAAVALTTGVGTAGAPAFHGAQSAAEQALERALKSDESPKGRVDPVGGAAGERPLTVPPSGAPYLTFLTSPLATAILVAEARQVKINCGGIYKSGELCGMDADPIICAQDFPKHYLFLTTLSTPNRVIVKAAWAPDQPGAHPTLSGSYRLTLTGGAWKIDGISCSGGDRYNWSTH